MDSATSGVDSLTSGVDSLTSGVDSVTSVVDSATSGVDSVTSGDDSLTSGVDSLASVVDSLTSVVESATSVVDSTTSGVESELDWEVAGSSVVFVVDFSGSTDELDSPVSVATVLASDETAAGSVLDSAVLVSFGPMLLLLSSMFCLESFSVSRAASE